MATKYKTNKRKISSLVKQQVPQFVLEDHPKFTEFLSSYYLFMESAELNLDTITEVDQIILETEGTAVSFVLLDQTDQFGLDAGIQLSMKKIHSVVLFRRMKSLQVQRLVLHQQFLQKIKVITVAYLFQQTMPGLQEKL